MSCDKFIPDCPSFYSDTVMPGVFHADIRPRATGQGPRPRPRAKALLTRLDATAKALWAFIVLSELGALRARRAREARLERWDGTTEAKNGPRADGFTLVELCIVVAIVGTLAAIGIPNLMAMRDRAREASTKANMHMLQLCAEGYLIDNGFYPPSAVEALHGLRQTSRTDIPNPWTKKIGPGLSWETKTHPMALPSAIPGIVSYNGMNGSTWSASAQATEYTIRGRGKRAPLTLILRSGQ